LLAGLRLAPAGGERGAHEREIDRVDPDGALPEVEVEHLLDFRPQHVEASHQVSDRTVAMARDRFRPGDVLVEVELSPREPAQRTDDACPSVCGVAALDQARDRDGARVDHRVGRSVRGLVEDDGVERVPCRLDADASHKSIPTMVLQRQTEHDRLRHRLDRERVTAVADLVDVPIDDRDRDAEQVGVDASQLGDVRRDVSVARADMSLVHRTKVGVDRRTRSLHRRGLYTRRYEGDVSWP
jgi:hypothetical protein